MSQVSSSASEANTLNEGQHVKDLERSDSHEATLKEGEKAEEVYSIFTTRSLQKWTIVFLAATASFISPVSGSIYLPVIPVIAKDLMTTEEAISLSVTVYMVVQGIAPLILGSSTDRIGRRPIYLVCLILYIASTAGLANIPDSYTALMLLRCLQAAGSSSLISIGGGVVSDLTTAADRGSTYGILLMGNTLGSCFGPLFGGLISSGFGWRAIFWFLFIVGSCSLILILFFQPETLRKLVGNGSKPAPTLIHESLASLLRGSTVTQRTGELRPGIPKDESRANLSSSKRCFRTISEVFAPFTLLRNPEITLTLIAYAIPYCGWYMLISSLSTVLTDTYQLSTLEIGLVYLAPGAGSAVGALVQGKLLDRDYQRVKSQQVSEKSHLGAVLVEDLRDFPLEQARCRNFPLLIAAYICSTLPYGWLVEYKVHISAPIIFAFFSTYMQQSMMSTFNTMLVDYKPSKGASVTALNNIFKCGLGAVGTAVIQYMINGVGVGWTFSIVCLFVSICIPIAWVLVKKGAGWRKNRK